MKFPSLKRDNSEGNRAGTEKLDREALVFHGGNWSVWNARAFLFSEEEEKEV